MCIRDRFNTDAKVIVLNIGMGGGKTTQTIEYLSTQKSLLWITPNQALSYDTHTRICESENMQLARPEINRLKEYVSFLQQKLRNPQDETNTELEAYKRDIIRSEKKYT